jgi:hypothetical protein
MIQLQQLIRQIPVASVLFFGWSCRLRLVLSLCLGFDRWDRVSLSLSVVSILLPKDKQIDDC